jgi:hypothetical protein
MKIKFKKRESFTTTESLSFGDYVAVAGGFGKIQEIACIEDLTTVWLSDSKRAEHLCNVFPLPLKQYWLDALADGSAFKRCEKENDGGYLFQIDSEKIKGEIRLRYVHELQHVLRLIES